MSINPQRILVLYRHFEPGQMRSGIRQHLHALKYSDVKHQIFYYNCLVWVPPWLKYLNFDVIIFHTTFLCLRWSVLFKYWQWQFRWLSDLNSVKIAIPQDEYDRSEILDEWLFELNTSIVFSNFNRDKLTVIYPKMQSKGIFYKCLTGYIDDEIAEKLTDKISPTQTRPYDIVYRATRLPYKFGSHGQLKHLIAEVFKEKARLFKLKFDISTSPQDSILGDKWFDFIASGKTIIGCEGGSSVLDKRGEIELQIQKIVSKEKTISFKEVSSEMPDRWDEYSFFAISPRHFEAIITKTCQILVEGYYDGILEKNKHYIPLNKDLSNIDEVIEKIRDTKCIASVAERAYKEIYLSGKYSYKKFANKIEKAIEYYYQKKSKYEVNRTNFKIFSREIIVIIFAFSSLLDKILYQLVYKICEKITRRIRNYQLLIRDKSK